MATDELTDADYDSVKSITAARYRGRTFETEIQPLLKQQAERAMPDDVPDSQLVYAGYAREADTFVLSFDLWLGAREDNEPQMAQQTFELRLVSGAVLKEQVKVVRSTRTNADGFYGDVKKTYEARYLDLVDLVLD